MALQCCIEWHHSHRIAPHRSAVHRIASHPIASSNCDSAIASHHIVEHATLMAIASHLTLQNHGGVAGEHWRTLHAESEKRMQAHRKRCAEIVKKYPKWYHS